jgi:hypothetical protein
MTFSDELKVLLKSHLRHSLCTGSVSVQTRVYLDNEEISNLRSELPKCKELSLDEILEIYNDILISDKASAVKFARAIEAKVRGDQ